MVVDLDVPGSADCHICVRAIGTDTTIKGADGEETQGSGAPRPSEHPVVALLQAARFQVQERTIHLHQMCRRLAIPVVSNKQPRPANLSRDQSDE
jgi:hypothetical protein